MARHRSFSPDSTTPPQSVKVSDTPEGDGSSSQSPRSVALATVLPHVEMRAKADPLPHVIVRA